jgi:hypothetical protein
MSTIQMAVDHCNCHNVPADHCVHYRELIHKGADPAILTLMIHEVLCPEDVTLDAGRISV